MDLARQKLATEILLCWLLKGISKVTAPNPNQIWNDPKWNSDQWNATLHLVCPPIRIEKQTSYTHLSQHISKWDLVSSRVGGECETVLIPPSSFSPHNHFNKIKTVLWLQLPKWQHFFTCRNKAKRFKSLGFVQNITSHCSRKEIIEMFFRNKVHRRKMQSTAYWKSPSLQNSPLVLLTAIQKEKRVKNFKYQSQLKTNSVFLNIWISVFPYFFLTLYICSLRILHLSPRSLLSKGIV